MIFVSHLSVSLHQRKGCPLHHHCRPCPLLQTLLGPAWGWVPKHHGSKQPFQHSFLNWSTIAPRCSVSSMLGGAATGQGCCWALLLSALPSYSRSLSQQSHLRDVPGCVNIWSGGAWTDIWAGQPNSPLSAKQWLWKHWTLCGKAHLCKFAGQNPNGAPTWSCESSLLFPVLYKGLNNWYLGQNLIPVLQQWTITIKDVVDLFFCYSKMERE